MQSQQVDIAIIGSGTAGLAAYREAVKHTDSVRLIEGGPYGTTCARVGCMPSKLLIAAAESAHNIGKSSAFGVRSGAIHIDGKAVMQRVRQERDRFVGFVLESVDEIPEAHRLRGYAKFIDAHQLQIDDHTLLNAKRIVIATGSRPAIPPPWEALGDRLIVNDDVFSWDDLPRSVAVFGPGVIGLELSQALHRLGVDVQLFGVGGAIGPLSDPEVKRVAKEIFQAEMPVELNAEVEDMHRRGDGVHIRWSGADGATHEKTFDYVLAATGRRANVDKLGLEKLDIALDERGVPIVDASTLQTSVPHIFLVGDANNLRPLLHEAADQGKTAGHNAGAYPEVRAGLQRSPIGVVFTDPNIAMVGHSYRELDQQAVGCGCIEVGQVSFENQGRSRVMLRNKGLLRVYGEQGTGRFLGAEMIGPNAEHLAHLLAWAHQQQMTVSQMLDMPFYHPVIEEGVRTALRDLNAKLHLGPAMIKHCLDCGPGC